MSRRLLRGSRATGQATEGIEIRESERVAAPVTLGVLRPAIVLPADWARWSGTKLDAVLAHEASHIRRFDPAVQLLSAIHRALLWCSPLSWFLHRQIVRVAEEASDDAALNATHNRALYAEVLLEFMRRGVRTANWLGVPMARYGRPDDRIHRILDGTTLSRGVTRWSIAAILALGSPLAYVVVAAHAPQPPQAQPPASASAPVQPAVPLTDPRAMAPHTVSQPTRAAKPQTDSTYLSGLGNVTPLNTVNVKSRADGQLLSVSFKEGDLVQAGQLLATVDPRAYEIQLSQAEGLLLQDQAALIPASADLDRQQKLVTRNAIPQETLDAPIATVAQLKGKMKIDQANVDDAQLWLSYTQIRAPITGVTGLRLVDAGNIVHATDATGIVIISDLQPISVVFTLPEDNVPQVLARLKQGAGPLVEAWNRDYSAKIATGRLTAVDNQIDIQTGTAKLRAVFDNKDGALYPNQFVNVRLFLNAR